MYNPDQYHPGKPLSGRYVVVQIDPEKIDPTGSSPLNLREVQAFGPRGKKRDYDGQGSITHRGWVPRLISFQILFEGYFHG